MGLAARLYRRFVPLQAELGVIGEEGVRYPLRGGGCRTRAANHAIADRCRAAPNVLNPRRKRYFSKPENMAVRSYVTHRLSLYKQET